MPDFVETLALLAVLEDDGDRLAELLDDMLPGELRGLYEAADRLRLAVWDHMGRPDMPRTIRIDLPEAEGVSDGR